MALSVWPVMTWLCVVQANTSGVTMGKWDAGCVDFLQKQAKHIVVATPTAP